jgi:hypothetical protein
MNNLHRGPSIYASYQFSNGDCYIIWCHILSVTQEMRLTASLLYIHNRLWQDVWNYLIYIIKMCKCIRSWWIVIESLPYMLPTKLGSFRFRLEEFFRNRPITLKSNYGSVFLTQNYELQFSFNMIITITYSTVADWSIPKKNSTLKPLGQMNRNVVGSIYGRPSIKIANFGSVNKHGQHRQFVLLIGRFINNFLLYNI